MSTAGSVGRQRIVLVGPTHPYTGGISHHTTALAHRLVKAGHDVSLVSWSAQYPARLYPGTARVPIDTPEVDPFANTSYPLAWNRPDTWWRVGRRHRSADLIVVVAVTPWHALPYSIMSRAVGKGTDVVAIVHNALPHEPSRLDRGLTKALFRSVERVVVHSPEQQELLREFGRRSSDIVVCALPPHFPGGRTAETADPRGRRKTDAENGRVHVLFFGTVRRYKGLDLLLRALAEAPDVDATVAGDFWEPLHEYQNLAREVGVQERVTWRPGYVSGEDVPGLFADADALVLPYRSGTASQNVALAGSFGVPSVVTDVGTLGGDVRDGVDGLVVPASDVGELAAALRRMGDPRLRSRLSANLRTIDADDAWTDYVRALV